MTPTYIASMTAVAEVLAHSVLVPLADSGDSATLPPCSSINTTTCTCSCFWQIPVHVCT